jgi:hypothetical protein
MIIHVGYVHEIVRYPVKSMAGVAASPRFLAGTVYREIAATRFVV